MTSHGTRSCYVGGCRQDECRRAHYVYMARWKERALPLGGDDRRHGSVNGYINYGCRCGPCTDANSRKGRARRARDRSAA